MDSFPLAKHFADASAKIKTHGTKKPDNDTLLQLYSLFKQAGEGDNTMDQPSFYQLEAKAKWNAWNTQKGKSKEQAQHEYVELAKKWLPNEIASQYV